MAEDVEVAADDDRLGARDVRRPLDVAQDGAKLRRLGRALLPAPAELRVGADDVVAPGALVDARMDEALGGVAVALDARGVDRFACGADRVPARDQHAAVLPEPGIALAAARVFVPEGLAVDRALLAARGGPAGAPQDAGGVAEALRPEPRQQKRARVVVIGFRQDHDIIGREEGRDARGALLLGQGEAFAQEGDGTDMRGQQIDIVGEDAQHLVGRCRGRQMVDPRPLADPRRLRTAARRQHQGERQSQCPHRPQRRAGPAAPPLARPHGQCRTLHYRPRVRQAPSLRKRRRARADVNPKLQGYAKLARAV